jgi:hypothetical protein
MQSSTYRRILAAAVIVAVNSLFTGIPALTADPSVFEGRVFDEDGLTPVTGVVVRLLDADTMSTFDSAPTDAEGRFSIDSAPAGRYSLQAKDRDRVFLASDDLRVEAGKNPPVSLTLRPDANMAPAQTTKKGQPLWVKATIAGGITIAGLFLIHEVTEDVEEPSSPF